MIIGQVENSTELSRLAKVVNTLDTHQLLYYIVGNAAVDTITGRDENKKHRRFDGTSGDIDILTPYPYIVGETLRKAGFRNGWLEVLHIRDREVDLGINRLVDLSDQNNPMLRYKSIAVSLPKEIFVINQVSLDYLSFPTLPAETLFHLYYLPWSLQEKVGSNALALEEWIRKHPTDSLTSDYYTGFIEYHKVREERYPLRAAALQRFANLKYRLESKINSIRERWPND